MADHTTGCFRGKICRGCNARLGRLEVTWAKWLPLAEDYLTGRKGTR